VPEQQSKSGGRCGKWNAGLLERKPILVWLPVKVGGGESASDTQNRLHQWLGEPDSAPRGPNAVERGAHIPERGVLHRAIFPASPHSSDGYPNSFPGSPATPAPRSKLGSPCPRPGCSTCCGAGFPAHNRAPRGIAEATPGVGGVRPLSRKPTMLTTRDVVSTISTLVGFGPKANSSHVKPKRRLSLRLQHGATRYSATPAATVRPLQRRAGGGVVALCGRSRHRILLRLSGRASSVMVTNSATVSEGDRHTWRQAKPHTT